MLHHYSCLIPVLCGTLALGLAIFAAWQRRAAAAVEKPEIGKDPFDDSPGPAEGPPGRNDRAGKNVL